MDHDVDDVAVLRRVCIEKERIDRARGGRHFVLWFVHEQPSLPLSDTMRRFSCHAT